MLSLAVVLLSLIGFLALAGFFVLVGIHERLTAIEYEANSMRTTLEIVSYEEDKEDIRIAERLDAWREVEKRRADLEEHLIDLREAARLAGPNINIGWW